MDYNFLALKLSYLGKDTVTLLNLRQLISVAEGWANLWENYPNMSSAEFVVVVETIVLRDLRAIFSRADNYWDLRYVWNELAALLTKSEYTKGVMVSRDWRRKLLEILGEGFFHTGSVAYATLKGDNVTIRIRTGDETAEYQTTVYALNDLKSPDYEGTIFYLNPVEKESEEN